MPLFRFGRWYGQLIPHPLITKALRSQLAIFRIEGRFHRIALRPSLAKARVASNSAANKKMRAIAAPFSNILDHE